ncbi:MAG TPA: Na/Pi symporter, partial [Acidimicrobiia bacterium]|nr:Na/Pi symporter [Acidimicrobiia bacterium]
VLAKSGLIGISVGALITMAVQSSSITTSILIPLVASGLLLVENAYPITLGANVGTTVTALLAAFAAGAVSGLTIAFVHVLFNIYGILILYPIPKIRVIPIRLAAGLARIAADRKWVAIAYVGGVFIALPILIIVVT